MPAVIETDRLTKRYGGARGIEDVSLRVERGEVFGFLGPNGAGKTTTIRTLLDLLRPTSGSARLFGLDSYRDSVAIRARVGNLPGDFAYDPKLSGRELLEFFARLRGLSGTGRAQVLAERLEADLERPLGALSHGNRQKIGLIQALFHDPELLTFDEPTSGLDPLMQEEFLAIVAEERDQGRTVLLSSHELDEVERVCDRVGGVAGGANLSLGSTAAGAASVWPLALFAAGVALVAAGVFHREATVTGVASGVLVAMYLVDVIGKLADPVEPLRALSAFKYYGAAMRDGLDLGGFAVLMGAAVLLAATGAQLFARRDVLH